MELNEISKKSIQILRDRGIVKQGKTTTGDFLLKLREETQEAEDALIDFLQQVRICVDVANASHNEAGKTYDDLAMELGDIIITCCSALGFLGQDGDKLVADKLRYNEYRADWN